jgi:hypothetical protein
MYTGDPQQRVITSYREKSHSWLLPLQGMQRRQCVLRVASTYQWYRYYNTMGLQMAHWVRADRAAGGEIGGIRVCDQQPDSGER